MNKKIFVSGCYDMLHSGHVAFLEEAAQLGDLYVGLGSDKTIFSLKKRRTINSDAERLYMVKALRCVKDAWINSGSGIMDFEEEVKQLKPDIFFVNTDGFTPAKETFCQEHGIQLVVSKRLPHEGLPDPVKILENKYVNKLIRYIPGNGFSCFLKDDILFVKEKTFRYMKILPYDRKKNNYYDGYWQTAKYFNQYGDDIRSIFTIKNEILNEIKPNWQGIDDMDSVSIHIRRGDYLKK